MKHAHMHQGIVQVIRSHNISMGWFSSTHKKISYGIGPYFLLSTLWDEINETNIFRQIKQNL